VTKWSFVKENDVIDVVAPGYPSAPQDVQGSHEFLLRWKLQPRIPKNIIKPHFLHANDDDKRFAFLKAAIEAPDSHVIWCLRGGYGSNRLLPYMAKLKKPKQTKLLIGLSDITSLHTFVMQEWGWSTLHSPILDRFGRGLVTAKYEKEIRDLLFGKTTAIEFKKLKPLNAAAKNVRTMKSKIVGGNLTVLQSTMGTPWQIDAKKSLLFLEDIGERGYRVDRMLEQFRQGGVLKNCDGIVLGDFIGGEEPSTQKNNFAKVFKRWADDLDIPLFQGMQAGHASVQRPVPFNTSCELKMEKSHGRLIIQSGGK
jgi:muramoyltetrapeptide carboxypeptidase